MTDEELAEQCLIVVSQLFSEQRITDEQRDTLKDMVFDDDTKLFGLLRLYQDESQIEELKNQITDYVSIQ